MAKAKKSTAKTKPPVEKAAENNVKEESAPAQRKVVKVTKKQAVKRYLAKRPDAGPKEISAALKKRGIEVSAQHVSVIKTDLRAQGIIPKPVASQAVAPPAVASTPAVPKTVAPKPTQGAKLAVGDQISLSDLLAAKQLVKQLGGIEQAKQAIFNLAQLTQ